jgi:hypothetical protein
MSHLPSGSERWRSFSSQDWASSVADGGLNAKGSGCGVMNECVGVGGEGEDDSSDIESERDGSQQVRLAGFAAGDVVLACEVSLRFRPILGAVSSDSSYSVTVSRSGLRFFGLCERFLVVADEKSSHSAAVTKPRASNKRASVARKARRRSSCTRGTHRAT